MMSIKKKMRRHVQSLVATILLICIFGISASSVFAQIEVNPGGDVILNGITNKTPVIAVLSQNSARIGTRILVTGANFTLNNNSILFNDDPIPVVSTSTSPFFNTLEFTVPAAIFDCNGNDCRPTAVTPRTYTIRVSNENGRSRGVSFTVLATPVSTSTVATSTVTTATTTTATSTPDTDGSGLEGGGVDLGGIAKFVATCAITSFVGNAGKTALSKVVGGASSWIKNKITGTIQNAISSALGAPEVPVKNPKIETNTQQTVQNTGSLAQKEISTSAPTGNSGILSGLTKDLFSAPSMDALAFCIGNELIHYILQSTIQWVNSGFQGKPVFIENSGAFFNQIADQEAGLFIQDIMKGANIDVCQPFRVQLAVDSIRSHTSTYGGRNGRGRCTLTAIKNNYEGFINNWKQGGLSGWFEIIQKPNNIYGAQYQAQAELRKRVADRQNTLKLELNWADGYRNFKYCDGPKRADGSCDPKYEKTGTPGKIIENTINQRINSAQHRIEIADEFDELVSALVNQLVKTAINEVLSIGSSSGGGGSQNSGGNSVDRIDPTVSIAFPSNNSVASSTVTIQANATDNIGIAGVIFKIDGANIGTEDTSSPYSMIWNTASTTNGVHRISATARDVAGNIKTSNQINVTVSN